MTVLSGEAVEPSLYLASESKAVDGHIRYPGEVDIFSNWLEMTTPSRVAVTVEATNGSTLDARLVLLDSQGQRLAESDDRAVGDARPYLDQHLTAGKYTLEVSSADGSTGTYRLSSEMTAASPPFAPLVAGDEPKSLISADFNADGIADLAVANELSEDVCVFLGVGDGTFQPAGDSYPTGGTSTKWLASGDFNQDGALDLAVANRNSSSVTILLGDGHGMFHPKPPDPPGPFSIHARPRAITAGWFGAGGGDPARGPDLATVNSGDPGSVTILNRNDQGGFDAVTHEIGSDPKSIAVGQFNDDNGDGLFDHRDYADLVTAEEETHTLSVLLGKANGTFLEAISIPTQLPTEDEDEDVEPAFVITGQFNDDNGDGNVDQRDYVDLVTANKATQDIRVLYGNGTGKFSMNAAFPLGVEPETVLAGDFNRDGALDLATSNEDSKDVSILLGSKNGTFGPARRFAVAGDPVCLASDDFNGDGWPDLAVALSTPGTVSIHLGRGDGTFSNDVPIPVGNRPAFSVSADWNNDGRLDLVTANLESEYLTVLLGQGDGTFREEARVEIGEEIESAAAGDFNGDGRLDLAVTLDEDGGILIVRGKGDGTFILPDDADEVVGERADPASGRDPEGIASGDFNHDGWLDLAIANRDSRSVSVLFGRPDGTFGDIGQRIRVSGEASSIVVGDLNQDPYPDIAVTPHDRHIQILWGRQDGFFDTKNSLQSPKPDVSPGLASLALADFDGNGLQDLARVNSEPDMHGAYSVSLLLATRNAEGKITFSRTDLKEEQGIGLGPTSVVSGDFNQDGRPDLAVTNKDSNDVSILLGTPAADGSTSLEPHAKFNVGRLPGEGAGPVHIIAARLNDDEIPDLAVVNRISLNVSVLLGNGDGNFELRGPFHTLPDLENRGQLRGGIDSLAAGDFNHDGKTDLAVADRRDGNVVLLEGEGDGSFRLFSGDWPKAGNKPNDILPADFNHDGNLDLVVANRGGNDLSLLIGNGDLTFQTEVRIVLGDEAEPIVSGDFNADGVPDLATPNFKSDTVSVFLGSRNGTFEHREYRVGAGPRSLSIGDFNRDGRPDLAVANRFDNSVSILMGIPPRTENGETIVFSLRPEAVRAGQSPASVVPADFNRDGVLDLAVANQFGGDISILIGRGDGTFRPVQPIVAGQEPRAILSGDFDGDGRADLATANYGSHDVSVLLGHGDGTFAAAARYAVDPGPWSLAAGDFNGDGQLDLSTANSGADSVSMLLGRGDGTFLLSETTVYSLPIRATPLLADFTGDRRLDAVVLDRSGELFLRRGRAGEPGVFEAPVIVNPAAPARDVAMVTDRSGATRLAAIDKSGTTVSIYALTGGLAERTAQWSFPPGSLLSRIHSGDLNHDGHGDLVIANPGLGEVTVLLATAAGQFTAASIEQRFTVGNGPIALELADIDGVHGPDILVANQISGDVSLLVNRGSGRFEPEMRLRAGSGVRGLGPDLIGRMAVRSQEGTVSLVAGDFNRDGLQDILAANSAAKNLAMLPGKAGGGLIDSQTVLAPVSAAVACAGQFNDDNRDGKVDGSDFLDLALLDEEQSAIRIFLGDGRGAFAERLAVGPDGSQHRISAGNVPTGLSLGDFNGDGRIDLLVGNEFGDLLTVPGNGDGTFQAFQRAGRQKALAVADLDGDRRDDAVVLVNEARDRLVVRPLSDLSKSLSSQDRSGLLAPGAVQVADLNGDGRQDMVVANGGGNNVLVYLGDGKGGFTLPPGAPNGFFVGTNPAAVTIKNLNPDKDEVLDLVVANEGSNDVSVLFGKGSGESWTLESGPRLSLRSLGAGTGEAIGLKPSDVQVGDMNEDGFLDLMVTNSGSNNAFLLPGVGGGFFNDIDPLVFSTGNNPRGLAFGNFDAFPGVDLAIRNLGSSTITYYSGLDLTSRIDFSSGGIGPSSLISGDINGDGTLDLIVGNGGDGVISLFLGGSDGLVASNRFIDPDVRHPAALALAGEGDSLRLLVADEGDELVRVFGREQLLERSELALADARSETGTLLFLVAAAGEVAALALAVASFLIVPSAVEGPLGNLFGLGDERTSGQAQAIVHTVRREIVTTLAAGTTWLAGTVEAWFSAIASIVHDMTHMEVTGEQIRQATQEVLQFVVPQIPWEMVALLWHLLATAEEATTTAPEPPTPAAVDQILEALDVEFGEEIILAHIFETPLVEPDNADQVVQAMALEAAFDSADLEMPIGPAGIDLACCPRRQAAMLTGPNFGVSGSAHALLKRDYLGMTVLAVAVAGYYHYATLHRRRTEAGDPHGTFG